MDDSRVTPPNLDRAQIRRQAGIELRRAGRAHLADLGLRPVSSSPRQWLGDHGWWLINVEFQSSSWSVGSYLNVGVQYLWTVTDHRSFGYDSPRIPIHGPEKFIHLVGAGADVQANADTVGHAARTAVQDLVANRGEHQAHLRWLSQRFGAGSWEVFDAAVASGLLDRANEASSAFEAMTHRLDRTIDWHDHLASDCAHLASLVLEPKTFRSEIDSRIAETRRLLRLPPRSNQD